MNLFELVEKYGTDKTLSNYTPTYSKLFEPIQDKVTSILEIGLGTLNPEIPSSFAGNIQHFDFYKPGGSLRVWRDYFPKAQVYGIDIAKDCMFSEERIKTFLFDSSEKEYCDYYLDNLEFDIIIDDGNHDPKYQVKTLRNLFPKLKEGGIYIIEDIGGYPGTEELLIEYLEEFEELTKGYDVVNKGNHIVIQKTKVETVETIEIENKELTVVRTMGH
jgi:8-demethyl-8-alpha-L-rhamnosyltetracenomycin-C 2'-O-methyltransferase